MREVALGVSLGIVTLLGFVFGHYSATPLDCPVVTGSKWMPRERDTNRIYFSPIPMGEE